MTKDSLGKSLSGPRSWDNANPWVSDLILLLNAWEHIDVEHSFLVYSHASCELWRSILIREPRQPKSLVGPRWVHMEHGLSDPLFSESESSLWSSFAASSPKIHR